MSTLQSRLRHDAYKLNQEAHLGVKKLREGSDGLRTMLHKSNDTKAKNSSSQTVYYSTVFEKVYTKRLSFFKRASGFLSVLVAIILTFLSSRASIFFVPIKAVLIFTGFILIQSLRELTLTVDTNPLYKNFWSQCAGELASKRFVNICLGYLTGGCLYYTAAYFQVGDKNFTYYVASPTRAIKPFFNDEFIHFWYHCFFVIGVYSLQHSVLLKSKLHFNFGVTSTKPMVALLQNQTKIWKFSSISTALITVTCPITYWLVRSVIYKTILYPLYWPLGLNHKMPLSKLSFSMFVYLAVVDFLLISSWNLVNHLFEIYATVGCINKGKPLSSLSKEPVTTLLSGLRDSKRPLVRVTAFQELAYIATADEFKAREFLYTAQYRDSFVWTAVLDECSREIDEAYKRLRARPKVLKNETSSVGSFTKPNIFGNSATTSKNADADKIPHYALKSETLVSPTKKPTKHSFSMANNDMEPIDIQKFFKPVVDLVKKEYNTFQNSRFGEPFKSTIEREAGTRIVNEANLGNALISIAQISLNAEFEDKKNIVISNLPEVLALLEKIISSTKLFTETNQLKEGAKNSVTEIHDLSLRLFFELVVKYNHMLSDFALSQPVFNLSKWCIDLAIEQQKELEFAN